MSEVATIQDKHLCVICGTEVANTNNEYLPVCSSPECDRQVNIQAAAATPIAKAAGATWAPTERDLEDIELEKSVLELFNYITDSAYALKIQDIGTRLNAIQAESNCSRVVAYKLLLMGLKVLE